MPISRFEQVHRRVIKMRAERDESDPFAMIAFINISVPQQRGKRFRLTGK